MTSRAFSGSLQKSGDSVRLFRSSSRACAVSQSKMPPQQVQHLLDFGDLLFSLGAHAMGPSIRVAAHVVEAGLAINPKTFAPA
jgi:hypothetical protein